MFGKLLSNPDGLNHRCKECRNGDAARYYAENPEKFRAEARSRHARFPHYKRTSNLRLNYGMTTTDYDHLHRKQGGVCAICGQPPRNTSKKTKRLHVDHDHKTGKVRGLLCDGCNRGLGGFRDSVGTLSNAIEYLRLFR